MSRGFLSLPRRRWLIAAVALSFVLGALERGPIRATFSAFSSTTSGSGTFSSAPDWTPPTIDRTVVQKSAGGTSGWIKQGGAYFVYANVSDTGNPAATPLTASATVTNVTTSPASPVSLSTTGGPWTVGGLSYNYRSASLTALNPLAAGSKTYKVDSADGASNSATQASSTVTVDDTAPTLLDVQPNNKTGGTAGRPEAGDTLVFTLTEANGVDPDSILSGWDGSSTNITVRITNRGAVSGNELVTLFSGSTRLKVENDIDLGQKDFVTGTVNFNNSPMVLTQSGSVATITITLGTLSGSTQAQNNGVSAVWTANTGLTDWAGNAVAAGTRTEGGTLDAQF